MNKWELLAEKSLTDHAITRDDAFSALNCPDVEVLALVSAAYKVRYAHFQNRVKLNFLLNIKSGICQEDCFYCSQSKISGAPIPKYPLMDVESVLSAAARAREVKAKRFCMVASGRGPTEGDIEAVVDAVRQVKEKYPELEICTCLGLLTEEQGKALKESGVCAYNHNLNTAPHHYSSICTTHTYQDRLHTVMASKQANLSSCSGCLFGMGETREDILDVCFALRELSVESIPINFLIPIPGTPLENTYELTPYSCLKILSLFRFVHPSTEIRVAGGREVHLRSLQPLALYVANSLFIGDYLTTKGQTPDMDLKMIADMGFEVEGQDGSGEIQPDLGVQLLEPKEGQRRKIKISV